MRTATVVVLSLLVAVAASAAVPHREADAAYLDKQQKILGLFYHVQQPIFQKQQIEIAKSFRFEDHYDSYKDPSVVKTFLKYYNTGHFKPRGETFSAFYKKDFYQVRTIFELFYYAKDFETFYKTAVWAREHLNEAQFVYAFTVAVLHREDTRDIVLPAPYEVYPQLFVKADVIQKVYDARLQGEYGTKEAPYYILANYSGYPVAHNPEELVSYFTEDVGLNSFFAYLHYRFPYWVKESSYQLPEFRKRGENFFFMLHQLLARYYLERLSNNLPDIKPVEFDRPIKVGYYPEVRLQNGVEAPARPEGVFPHDIDFLTIQQAKNYERRLYDAIDFGYLFGENFTRYNLKEEDFTDLIGNLVEGNFDSVNKNYYGSLYRTFLSVFGHITDPVHRYGANPSVLEQPETFLRDPLFYRIAKRILAVFYHYKNQLPEYTYKELEFPGVKIDSVTFDKLVTYFSDFDFELNNVIGVHDGKQGEEFNFVARQHRLNHKPFSYHLKVTSDKEADSIVRVFLGPQYDVYGREFSLDEKRHYYYLLDIFDYKLTAGENVIERNSKQMPLYGSDAPRYGELFHASVAAAKGENKFLVDEFSRHYGFPQRLAIPRGTRSGLPLSLFVVITPAKQEFSHPILPYGDGHSYGFPFDRRAVDFEFEVPNAHFDEVYVVHRRQEDVAQPA